MRPLPVPHSSVLRRHLSSSSRRRAPSRRSLRQRQPCPASAKDNAPPRLLNQYCGVTILRLLREFASALLEPTATLAQAARLHCAAIRQGAGHCPSWLTLSFFHRFP